MPVFSSIFLVLALVLAVVIGPQTRSWTWGPAMLSLGISLLAALPTFWKREKCPTDFGLLAFGTMVAGWFAWRAWISPVAELGQADLLLVSGAVATFICIRAIEGHALAERILIWGTALLLLANLVVVGKQVIDPDFTPVFRSRASSAPSGFYAQYNEAANYLIASSMLVGAAAIFGSYSIASRLFWGLIAISGLVGIYYTHSRGGVFGGAVGSGVLAALTLIIAKRRKARWFVPAMIALPVVALLIGGYLIISWQKIQNLRHAGSGITEMMDNDVRLYLLGIALSCIGQHPWVGGGSRSFSWESFHFWDLKIHGPGMNKPEQAHNELLQAATDYGIIGAGLLIGLFGTLVVIAMVRILFSGNTRGEEPGDSWRLGALAGLAGMFVQSSFSFVFHLFPGILLLGICLGQLSRASNIRGGTSQMIGSRILLTIAAFSCCLVLLPYGWKGSRVTTSLWPVYFSKQPLTSAESKIDALTEAIRVWPQSGFYQERAASYQAIAASGEVMDTKQATEAAIHDYRQATILHPYDPGILINGANLLSESQLDPEAETDYANAIRIQGGMEPAFQGHLSAAGHYLRKGLRQYLPDDSTKSLASLEIAADQVEKSFQQTPNYVASQRGKDMRISIHESLGAARESSGDRVGALQSYDFVANTLINGNRANYRAGILIGKMAAEAWAARRPSEALGYFIKARDRIAAARELPQGVAPSQRVEYLAYLDQTIAFLKGAKVEPLSGK